MVIIDEDDDSDDCYVTTSTFHQGFHDPTGNNNGKPVEIIDSDEDDDSDIMDADEEILIEPDIIINDSMDEESDGSDIIVCDELRSDSPILID